MSINDVFWKQYWELLDSKFADGSEIVSPEVLLKEARSIGGLHLVDASKHDHFSLFQIAWAAYTLATSDAQTTSLLSGLAPAFRWRHGLACLVIMEMACFCENGCFPEWTGGIVVDGEFNERGVAAKEKLKSPFFPLLVQSSLAMLHRAMEHNDGDDQYKQIRLATLLDFVEVSVLPDMLGAENYKRLQQDIATGVISDDMRIKVDEAVHLWTSVYASDEICKSHLNPLITLAPVDNDEPQQREIRKLLEADAVSPVDRVPSSRLLSVDSALDKIAPPFARPLPPPSFPIVGYDEDDFDALSEAEMAELVDYLHAELIWCTPICNRLMLLPDDEDEDKEANELYKQVLELFQEKAFVKPLAPNERRQVIELLSSSDQAERLMQEAGLSPKNLPLLVEYNPLVAHECLLKVLQTDAEEEKNEYLSSLVGMDMSLHSMEVVNRLATHYVANVSDGSPSRVQEQNNPKPKPILHPEYIHLFIGSCIASCENIQDRHAQNRLVRLVCVFIQSLLRNKIVETEDIYFEVQSFCVEFSRIREASALFKSLKQQNTG